MARRTVQANYFADDKDIFDLLISAKQKLSGQKLVDLARRRGLVLSASTDRDELVEQISILPFGWQDLNDLIAATDSIDRAEKVASRALSGSFSVDEIADAIDVMRDLRDPRGETYKLTKLNKGLRVTVGYSELDTGRMRLAQRTQREFVLEIEVPQNGEALVRHQDQPRAKEVLNELIELLASKPNETLEASEIQVVGIRDAALRTEFFLKLMQGIGGFQFEDVKSVRASRFREIPEAHSLDNEDGQDEGVEQIDDPEPGEVSAGEASFVTRVKEIALKGDGLLHSQQYEQLAAEGFFVRSIVWTSTEGTAQNPNEGPRVEFESGFADPEEGTGFTYTIRAVYQRKTDGELKKGRGAANPTDRTRLLRLVETAARAALDDVVSRAGTGVPGGEEK